MHENNDLIKLNLGSGTNCLPGFINVDKFGKPDILFDLETFPWPWEDDSVGEVLLFHVLEHLGQLPEVYFGIIKELYRICAPGATIRINVPHPRHDNFINDPTHIRAITIDGLHLFSKKMNHQWIDGGFSNSTLGLYLDVDFEVTNNTIVLDPYWQKKLDSKEVTEQQVREAISKYNNVLSEIQITLKAIK